MTEKRKQYLKIYRQTHKEAIAKQKREYRAKTKEQQREYLKIWRKRPEIKEKHKIYNKNYSEAHKWIKIYFDIKSRCESSYPLTFKYYKGAGIKCSITIEELKTLMEQKDYLLIRELGLKPEIHRLNNNGNYEIGNVTFLPKKIHRALHKVMNEIKKEKKKEILLLTYQTKD